MPLRASRWIRPAILLLGSLMLTACSSVFFGGINAVSSREGVVEHPGQIFDSEHGLALDVYQPRGAVDAPVVVFFYGGTWKRGKRANYRWMGEALARQGVVAMVADYRKYPQVGLQGFMADAANATAWSYRHAHAYGGDPKRLAVMGHSAGAHIAGLLATDRRWLQAQGIQPQQLCGFVGLAGPYDFLPMTDPELVEIFGTSHDDQVRSQPVLHVDGNEPPMLLLHGDADRIVEPQNSVALASAMRSKGKSVQVKLYPGVGHMRLALAFRKPPADSPELRDTLQFLRQCKAP
ncbi:alpha/beta hydrolase [Xanthomonas vesicatoria]|uniref:Alpha/beta hydrolase n=2 Tax=Xanthomonas vesicatoria TaxID=56460 RepID=A0AAJ0N4K4_9XANT|nr:alpha/beta hydrolase [Xanthomonas vesicatoria]APO94161.1 alpha/beta hydrolase [Xanthomonas vesicatoria]APP74398.1 alpha/beta hydrolase [Xanthomonas vesicatoria ATCC 35937]EGD08577.1 esterase/lipase [Xanthomonas vesicatoria ATCC 35937]KHM94677.1 carboxylesterase [Xanthomonas vesicatoria]KHM95785.1 carboxylesterase [Xanthomonas vesicatoria]